MSTKRPDKLGTRRSPGVILEKRLDPICCIESDSDEDCGLDSLHEFINEYPFWPNIIIRQMDDHTLCLLAADEPVQLHTKRWKTLEKGSNLQFSSVISKKSIASKLESTGGYHICKVFPEICTKESSHILYTSPQQFHRKSPLHPSLPPSSPHVESRKKINASINK